MRNYVIIGLLVISAFVGGCIIGSILIPQWTGALSQEKSDIRGQGQSLQQNNTIKNPSKSGGETNATNESLRLELDNLKSIYERAKLDYAQRLDKEILARSEVNLELARLKERLTGKEVISPTAETKPKKKSPFAQAIRMQVEKQFKNRAKILKEKAFLSTYQENELERLTNEIIEKTAELGLEAVEKIMAGEEMPPELLKQTEETDKQYEQQLKELLTDQQYTVHQEILEAERKERVAQTVKMYMDGMPGMKGITESVSLSQEQQQKVKTLFEERFNNTDKPKETVSVSVGPQLPFDDKEFTEKVKTVLTVEQYPKFEEYLKQQEELRKMAESFRPKAKEEKENK